MLGVYSKNKVRYTGTDAAKNTLDHGVFAFNPVYYLILSKGFIRFDAGFAADWSTINGEIYRDIYPYAHIEGRYSPNSKNSVNFRFQYATNETSIGERSPNILQSNELLYYTGNPDLKNARRIDIGCNYSWMPSKTFTATAFVKYFGTYNRVVAAYYPYGNNAIIRRFENNGDFHNGSLGMSFRLSLLKQRLMFMVSPTQRFFKSTGYYDISHNPFALNTYAQYMQGNFFISASYSIASKSLSERGVWTRGQSKLDFSLGWANSDWNIMLYCQNMLHGNYLASTSYIKSPVYEATAVTNSYDGKRSVTFIVSYTFGYGKKVGRNNEINQHGTSVSGVLE